LRGSIYERKPGTWEVRVYDKRAKRCVSRTVHGTRKDADKASRELIADLEGGKRDAGRMTVAEFLGRWISYLENTDLAPRTVRGYRRICELHLIPALGRIRLAELGSDHIQKFYKRASTSGRKDDQRVKKSERAGRDRSLSARTVLSFHRCLHIALEWGRRQGWVNQNVSELAKPPRARKKKFRRLSVAEAKKLIHSTEGTMHVLVMTALLTGLRQGEQLGLRWSDIDFERCVIDPCRQLVKAGREPIFADVLKNEASEREIPMIGVLAEALAAHKKRQAAQRLRLGGVWQDYGLVFTGPCGEPISGPDLTREAFKKDLAAAGLPAIRWHDLRHSTASLLLDMGVDLPTISRILRHAGIQITADTYADVSMDKMRESLDKVGDAIK
jgi:integrase